MQLHLFTKKENSVSLYPSSVITSVIIPCYKISEKGNVITHLSFLNDLLNVTGKTQNYFNIQSRYNFFLQIHGRSKEKERASLDKKRDKDYRRKDILPFEKMKEQRLREHLVRFERLRHAMELRRQKQSILYLFNYRYIFNTAGNCIPTESYFPLFKKYSKT